MNRNNLSGNRIITNSRRVCLLKYTASISLGKYLQSVSIERKFVRKKNYKKQKLLIEHVEDFRYVCID